MNKLLDELNAFDVNVKLESASRPSSSSSKSFTAEICGIKTDILGIKYRCLLGEDSEERCIAIRSLAEQLDIHQPLLLSLSIVNFDYNTISAIAKVILENKFW